MAVLPFETEQAFEAWLEAHHADQPGLWVKFAKKGRGIASISFPGALEVAMCFDNATAPLKRPSEHPGRRRTKAQVTGRT